MKKLILVLFMLICLTSIVYANECGGSLPSGSEVSDPTSCASCHVKVVPIYKSFWGKLTKDVIGHQLVCASEFSVWLDGVNPWIDDAEFLEKYPTGEAVELALQDIANERATIELENLLYYEKKKTIKEANLVAWGLNVALIKLAIELLRTMIYIAEVWFIIFIFLIIIPYFFFKIRDAILVTYIRRRNG